MSLSKTYNLYDRIISVSFYSYDREVELNNAATRKMIELASAKFKVGTSGLKDPYRVITIPYMGGDGMKPNIDVTLTMLPSSICFNMTVTLHNAALVKNINIRKFQYMTVKMGYTDNSVLEGNYIVETFTGPVFSSYIEKPSPNNQIVFEGIAVGKTGVDLFAHSPYRVTFYASSYTVREICEKIAKAIGVTTNFEHCDTEAQYHKVSFSDYQAHADNKYTLITWLQSMLYSHYEYLSKAMPDPTDGSLVEGVHPFVYVFLREDTMYVVSNTGAPTTNEKRNAILLATVKSASFQAAVLNVEAPYNPRLHPGEVFKMDPIYYKGGAALLNQMSTSVFNPDDGYYRALKIEVRFSTYGSQNSMSIMALPTSMYTDGEVPEEATQPLEEWAQKQREAYQAQLEKLKTPTAALAGPLNKGEAEIAQEVVFGNPHEWSFPDSPTRTMWSSSWAGWTSAKRIKTTSVYTIPMLALQQWGDGKFYLDDSQLTESFDRNQPEGVPYRYFFPLIMVATYKMSQQLWGQGVYYIDRNDPEYIREGYSIAVPELNDTIIKTFIKNTQVIGIFKDAIKYYEGRNELTTAKAMGDIVNYLEKGKRV